MEDISSATQHAVRIASCMREVNSACFVTNSILSFKWVICLLYGGYTYVDAYTYICYKLQCKVQFGVT